MSILLPLLSPSPYLDLPQGLTGWAGWLGLLVVVALLLWKWREFNQPLDRRARLLLILMVPLTALASLLLAVYLPDGGGLPPPGIPIEQASPAVVLLSAVPWVLAAGLFGPLPAAVLALFGSLLRTLWDSHSLFYPLEVTLLAVLFSAAINQRYRTLLYRLLRRPVISGSLLAFLFPVLSLFDAAFNAQGILVSRLDYALTHLSGTSLAMGIELVIAGFAAEALAYGLPGRWARQGPLLPSPAERSLQARFLYGLAPLAVLLVATLMVGDWYVAGNAARDMLQARMANSARLAAQSLPYFLESGQNLISQLAGDARLYSLPADQLPPILADEIKTIPFFRQLMVINLQGEVVASHPTEAISAQLAHEEQTGVQLALSSGIPVQSYAVPPVEGGDAAQVSFIAIIKDEKGTSRGVLIGRSDLGSNPFTQPVIASLTDMAGESGQGLLVDENSRILYHPDPTQLMQTYSGKTADDAIFYDDIAPDGTRRLVYFQRAEGRPWAVVLRVPAQRAQQLALRIAAPLLGMILLLTLLGILFLRLALSVITASLKNLSFEARRISAGKLDNPLVVEGEDEVGALRRAFEGMRASLKARLDELNRLLLVSQGVASSLDMAEAIRPVLDSALATGACSARVVLTPAVMPELEGDAIAPVGFGAGPARELYSDLDEQILAFTRQQDRLVLTNPNRPRLLNFMPGSPRPESLLAVALRHENLYYGTFWVAYDRPHTFTEEEVRFLATLGGQAALAAANARLFLNAEIGRQRLAAILDSSPDPILVTDQRDRLLLANPAAWQVLNMGLEPDEGQPIDKIISQRKLLDMLRSSSAEKGSAEIILPGGQVYLAIATSVLTEGRRVGRVCILRDVTRFKELDAMKSDFVSTVSHDLRSPLTLMRGYATMLEMVGELNEQQVGYVRKIVGGVESMSRLVNNLLDLGRIEAGIGLQLEMVPVQDVIERVASALQLQAGQKRIQLGTEIAEGTAPLVEADQALLQQALHNLVENAVKYTRPEGRVTVRVGTRQERMLFEISDTGIGISPMDQPRLFEKFYRGAQQASKEQRSTGTGLGLAIVKSIAERHGGQVWVDSQLGKGSTFYLSIPLRQPRADSYVPLDQSGHLRL